MRYISSPCFDEPALKATYSIIIEHPEGSYAVSNWPVKVAKILIKKILIKNKLFLNNLKSKVNITVNNQKRIETSFETTYKMSSYLAAWGIFPENNFSYKETKTNQGIPVSFFFLHNIINNKE